MLNFTVSYNLDKKPSFADMGSTR